MVTNGITYIKKESLYEGDKTKGGNLTSCEVDNNFRFLYEQDIEDVRIDGYDLVIKLKGGKEIVKDDFFRGYAKNISIEFDNESKKLYLINDGVKMEVADLNICSDSTKVATDHTLEGDGTLNNPLRVSDFHKAGVYSPVVSFVDKTKGESLPGTDLLKVGHRVLSKEYTSPFGLLYSFNGLKNILCHLKAKNSEWRVPSKEDWDLMLNAIEPLEASKKHLTSEKNLWVGKSAGKLLKANEYWNKVTPSNNNTSNAFTDLNDTDLCPATNSCVESACGTNNPGYEKLDTSNSGNALNPIGIDKYGFSVLPAGSGDDGKNVNYFGERAVFWTTTHQEQRTAYVKRFDYDKTETYQDSLSSGNYFSLRLVKDYTGSNYHGDETILGKNYPTVIMPSADGKAKVWTSVNIDLNNIHYEHLVPNNGINLPKRVVYFINEWDGEKWVRTELKNGESVVLVENDSFVDYIVINGELVDKNKAIMDKVDAEITKALDKLKENNSGLTDEIEALKGRVDTNEDNIAENLASIEKLQQKDVEIEGKITTINETINEIKELDKTQSEKIATIEGVIAQNVTQIEGLVDTIDEKANELSEKIDRLKGEKDETSNEVHVQDGSTFNKDTGVLLLKSKGGNNDIQINLGFNFGDI